MDVTVLRQHPRTLRAYGHHPSARQGGVDGRPDVQPGGREDGDGTVRRGDQQFELRAAEEDPSAPAPASPAMTSRKKCRDSSRAAPRQSSS